ncbi:MAG: hypothetical protein OIF48_20895 [Silicimonas sp.]|nr:hypothetical protein [Silicimonas sp.]
MSVEPKPNSRPVSQSKDLPAAKPDGPVTKPEKDKPVFRDWAAI